MSDLKTNLTFEKVSGPLEIIFFLGLVAIIVILGMRINELDKSLYNIQKKQYDNDAAIKDATKPPTEYFCPKCPQGWALSPGGTHPLCKKFSKYANVSGGSDILDCAPGKHSRTEAHKCIFDPPFDQRVKQTTKC